jgi:hypothetical protein
MATNLDTFNWVQSGTFEGVRYNRTRTLKAWQLEKSKQYKGLMHDTKTGEIKEIIFSDYWDLVDWIDTFDFKFINRQEMNLMMYEEVTTWARLQLKYTDNK